MIKEPLLPTAAFVKSVVDPDSRYYISGNLVIFLRRALIFHISFGENYADMTTIEARRKLKKYYTRGQQNDILHYLKEKNYLKA